MAQEEDEALPYEQAALEGAFMEGVEAMQGGHLALAEERFRRVLLGDPRLPEPRMELAVILMQRDELEEAEEQARLALEQVERGWQWLDVMEDAAFHAHALTLLGEILTQRASGETSDTIPGEELQEMWQEAEGLFKRAVQLDPSNIDALRNLAGFKARRMKA